MRAFTVVSSSQALVFADESVGKPQTPTPFLRYSALFPFPLNYKPHLN